VTAHCRRPVIRDTAGGRQPLGEVHRGRVCRGGIHGDIAVRWDHITPELQAGSVADGRGGGGRGQSGTRCRTAQRERHGGDRGNRVPADSFPCVDMMGTMVRPMRAVQWRVHAPADHGGSANVGDVSSTHTSASMEAVAVSVTQMISMTRRSPMHAADGCHDEEGDVNTALRDYVARIKRLSRGEAGRRGARGEFEQAARARDARSVPGARPSSDHVSGGHVGSVAPVPHPGALAPWEGTSPPGCPPLRADTCRISLLEPALPPGRTRRELTRSLLSPVRRAPGVGGQRPVQTDQRGQHRAGERSPFGVRDSVHHGHTVLHVDNDFVTVAESSRKFSSGTHEP